MVTDLLGSGNVQMDWLVDVHVLEPGPGPELELAPELALQQTDLGSSPVERWGHWAFSWPPLACLIQLGGVHYHLGLTGQHVPASVDIVERIIVAAAVAAQPSAVV